jgi:serine/threonine-protein kinase
VLQPQQLFADRYRIVRPLAEGGMGAVFVAQHTATEALVALKVLWPHLIELDRARRSFELEAKIAARVRSEHIVKVVDAGLDSATRAPFLVMELLEGVTLAEHVWRSGPRPFAETANWVAQTARGLDAAHGYRNAAGAAEPIVHRDLKPENLFLTLGNHTGPLVKILDFGIAKVLGESTQLSQEVRGTPLYMAYEQVAGEEISPRTDVWALGLIAYFLLTGRCYWRSIHQVQALFAEILSLPMPFPSQRAREDTPAIELPEGFDAWLFGCIDRDPRRRFASAGEAARAFAALEAARVFASPEATSSARFSTSSEEPSAVQPLAPQRTIPAVEGADALVVSRLGRATGAAPVSAMLAATPGSVPSLTTAVEEPAVSAPPGKSSPRARLVAAGVAAFALALAGAWFVFGERDREGLAPLTASATSNAAGPGGASELRAEPPPERVAPSPPHSAVAYTAPSVTTRALVASAPNTTSSSPALPATPPRAPKPKPRAPSSHAPKKPPAFVELPP